MPTATDTGKYPSPFVAEVFYILSEKGYKVLEFSEGTKDGKKKPWLDTYPNVELNNISSFFPLPYPWDIKYNGNTDNPYNHWRIVFTENAILRSSMALLKRWALAIPSEPPDFHRSSWLSTDLSLEEAKRREEYNAWLQKHRAKYGRYI